MVLKKIINALLVILAGAMFPAAFVLMVVAALHILDRTPMNIFTLPLAFALWGLGWLVMRRLAQHD